MHDRIIGLSLAKFFCGLLDSRRVALSLSQWLCERPWFLQRTDYYSGQSYILEGCKAIQSEYILALPDTLLLKGDWEPIKINGFIVKIKGTGGERISPRRGLWIPVHCML